MCFATIGLAMGASSATATMAGLQAVSGAVSAMGALMSYQQQQSQYKAEQARYRQNQLLAQRSMLEQARQVSIREEQERSAAMDRLRQSNIEAAKVQGRMVASAGEAGVSGMSIAGLLADVERTKLNNEGTINRNFDSVLQQGRVDREGLLSQAEGRVNSMNIPQAPSLLGTGLQIAGIGLDSYSKYRSKLPKPVYNNDDD